jgi:hypothetical protein
VARRKRKQRVIATVSGRVSLRVKFDNVQLAIERELGVDQEQLELAIAAGESSPVVCSECGRWNYHLASCSRKELPIG